MITSSTAAPSVPDVKVWMLLRDGVRKRQEDEEVEVFGGDGMHGKEGGGRGAKTEVM